MSEISADGCDVLACGTTGMVLLMQPSLVIRDIELRMSPHGLVLDGTLTRCQYFSTCKYMMSDVTWRLSCTDQFLSSLSAKQRAPVLCIVPTMIAGVINSCLGASKNSYWATRMIYRLAQLTCIKASLPDKLLCPPIEDEGGHTGFTLSVRPSVRP